MKDELNRIFKSKMLIATLVGVVILPLIYGGLYLYAFWDPYGKMENLPVAIVNNDTCATRDGEKKCFGQDLVDKLNEEKNMNWQFMDEKTATSGLNNKTYYTMAIIPKDFSEKILSVDSDNPQKAEIEFKSRQASSFMASKFTDTAFVKIKAALNEKISKEYIDNIFSETRDSLEDLNKAVDGASDLADGLKEAKDGSKDLYEGIDKANSGAVDLKNGLGSLYDGAEKLKVGSSDALTGTNKLLDGIKQITNSTDSLSAGQNLVIAKINAYIQAHPEASTSAELMTALGAATQVNNGITQFKAGSTVLQNGLSSLSVGISNIATGSASLKDGIGTARDGDQKLIEGLEEIKDGENDLGEGLAEAYDGSIELRDKLAEAIDKTKEKTNETKNNTQSEVMSAPVDIHDVSIDIVMNNGTGFAPYFIPLALWVGAMAIFFLVELELKKKKKIKEFLPKLGLSLLVSTIQTLTLDLVLIKLIGMQVAHIWQFVLFTILLGFSSTLIQLFLTLSMGIAGKFVGIVLLMLQLTSSAGSYPIETAPIFFQKINPYLPMTYAVSALRELISGDNFKIVGYDVRAILIFCLISLVTICLYLIKRFKMLPKRWIKRTK